MISLLLIGGGGHCRSCIDVIESEGRFAIAGVVQPARAEDEQILGYPVVGTDDDIPALVSQWPYAVVTVGQIMTPAPRVALYRQLVEAGAKLPVIAAATAHVSNHAVVGDGSIIMHGAVVNANARVGANCIVNNQALIEHDVVVGEHCHISTGALVNGQAVIGSGSFVGSGTVVREGVTIGANAIIAAGCLVMADVPARAVIRSSA